MVKQPFITKWGDSRIKWWYEIMKKKYKEKIICPECGQIQYAKVEDTIPFPTYIHKCEKCEYIILESEWHLTNT